MNSTTPTGVIAIIGGCDIDGSPLNHNTLWILNLENLTSSHVDLNFDSIRMLRGITTEYLSSSRQIQTFEEESENDLEEWDYVTLGRSVLPGGDNGIEWVGHTSHWYDRIKKLIVVGRKSSIKEKMLIVVVDVFSGESTPMSWIEPYGEENRNNLLNNLFENRYYHDSIIFNDFLYIYGGITSSESPFVSLNLRNWSQWKDSTTEFHGLPMIGRYG